METDTNVDISSQKIDSIDTSTEAPCQTENEASGLLDNGNSNEANEINENPETPTVLNNIDTIQNNLVESSENAEVTSPLPSVNIETHLESNINVIENQNNENLERDSERMENSETENLEASNTESHDSLESSHLKQDNANLLEEPIEPSNEVEDTQKNEKDESQEDLFKNVEDNGPSCNSTTEEEKDLKEQERKEDCEESEKDCDSIFSKENVTQEDTALNKGTIDNESIISDNKEAAEQEVDSTSLKNDEEKTNVEEDRTKTPDKCNATENEDPENSKVDAASDAPDLELADSSTNKVNIEDVPSKDQQIEPIENENKETDIANLDREDIATDKITEEPTSKDTDDLDKDKDITVDSEKDNETDEVEKEDEATGDDSEKGKSPKDNANKDKETDVIDKEKDTDAISEKNDEIDTEKSDTAKIPETDKPITDSSIRNDETNGENIEFAQVDFESNENEKENEEPDKEDDSNKDVEMDPIASDLFEPAEDREGADEELCIIPDTEREISQAEKDAASTIPPLRDISEASSSALATPDAESTDSTEIKIYKYDKDDLQLCRECKLKRKVKYHFTNGEKEVNYICDNNCLDVFKQSKRENVTVNVEDSGSLRVKNFTEPAGKEPPSLSFVRKCASCKKTTDDIENNLTWEIMDFCNEFCLSKYQKEIGSKCSSCSGEVKAASLGKYCVRFGNDIRQFCTSACLEQYKKGLKVCSYCQQDMSNGPEGFLAPVGEKGQFKDFCSKLCMEKYDIMTNDRPPKVDPGTICSVCKTEKPITIEFELDSTPNYFCGEPCFVAFSFVNKISPGKCAMCRRHFNKTVLEQHTMYYDNVQHSFCSNSCENIYIIAHRKIVPCSWCKVKKYNFDMIKKYSKSGPVINMCSINCLSLYQVSLNAVNSKKITCNYCQKNAHPMYHLTMSDATIRNFCSYNCVMSFQNQFPKQPITLNNMGDSGFPVPLGVPKKNKKCPPGSDTGPPVTDTTQLPVISSVQSLASTNGSLNPQTGLLPGLAPISTSRLTRSKSNTTSGSPTPQQQSLPTFTELPVQIQVKQHFIVRPAPYAEQKNVATMCTPRKDVKGIQAKPTMVDAGVQTEKEEVSKILIPIPVPIYVPAPCHMFTAPVPIPVPFPLPIPIPIFIPTTRNSSAGIMKEIKKIQVKIPTDPYEAELLMMAEMVAEEKKEDHTDSESDLDDNAGDAGDYSPEPVDASNTFGDDMLQMALKMATELDEPAVDLEGALTANTITAPHGGHQEPQDENVDDPQPMHHHVMERGRKRGMRGGTRGQSKRGRRMSQHQVDIPMMQQVQQPPPPPEPQEKPDANMCLKYTFGVNAWKQWVTTKNVELEKSSRRVKLFKTEILQLTADELNYSLCLFVKEVRKPNGQEYAPDTIYYLCLGIQQYLFENGRIDNIFCDPYYEKFTDCLDEVAKKFSVLYNDSHYIVTRVEEEHLWESKQLGAHSPHVLLSTLMFFNTKHFNLTSVDEHMQLSFSHIMKHWKRNPNQPGASKVPGSRNVLLRFYPPQSAIQNNQRKKKVYEQQENEENPLRCPVKLYEFYLSKCPESVKTRNDVFYLQPERSCVPDSPVWYSTMPLAKEALEKMLHRVKMVKEINVALLTS